ncbi:hypothetical protein [Saccharothrix lopnurensis]|uniref:Uncharacterized protein n=1 Tax=Saccharothrix lopnurensis TaxID=1670621 RepID=A0ABW1PF44_9PSEU
MLRAFQDINHVDTGGPAGCGSRRLWFSSATRSRIVRPDSATPLGGLAVVADLVEPELVEPGLVRSGLVRLKGTCAK